MHGGHAPGPMRAAAFAGDWYPREAAALAAEVDRSLEPVDLPFAQIAALISPHAGLMYAGGVAGRGYACVAEARRRGARFDVGVLVGPSHSIPFSGVAVFPHGSFDTPFGALPVDADLATRLMRASASIHADPAAHALEHSLEMQLPFMARVLPDVPIVPLLIGRQTRATADALAAAIASSLDGRRALLVASSDLSHFHDRRTATELDAVVLGHLDQFDPDGLQASLERFPHHACGGGPMVAVMRAARALGATDARVLQYADSGDVSGDVNRVVGYVSAVMGRKT